MAHHVARSDGVDQAFPMKKLCRVARNLCRAGHRLTVGIVTITRRSDQEAVITGCRQRPHATRRHYPALSEQASVIVRTPSRDEPM